MIINPNKDERDAENYQPLQLTNCLAEIYETAENNIFLTLCGVFGGM